MNVGIDKDLFSSTQGELRAVITLHKGQAKTQMA